MDNSIKDKILKKWTMVIVFDVILLLAIVLSVVVFRPFSNANLNIEGVYLDSPRDIANFYMMDQHGHPFTKSQLSGHWTLLFFGFTHCQMICPATFATLNKMMFLLERQIPARLLPQIVFITIDPEKDTTERLNQYINAYNPHFIGARADTDKTVALQNTLSFSAVNFNGTIDHNTDILLVNPKGQIQAYFLYPHRADRMALDYQSILKVYL